MKIYVASSWRNIYQPGVITALQAAGHTVYDFRHPTDDDNGFHWSEIDSEWMNWTSAEYRDALHHPAAQVGYAQDFAAMEWADAFVLVHPCGRSAHLELGWACGRGKQTIILLADGEPELMVKMADHICCDIAEVIAALGRKVIL